MTRHDMWATLWSLLVSVMVLVTVMLAGCDTEAVDLVAQSKGLTTVTPLVGVDVRPIDYRTKAKRCTGRRCQTPNPYPPVKRP